ncbi:UNVERIFIED_CONTAM: hypothetical protein Sradi_0310600 [Sesamum radiatum]|uniref:Uncharacterized protein n=1 Tax=Sesamum radiatum TaxID=300843 RepID=A0AAW2W368_SESRA
MDNSNAKETALGLEYWLQWQVLVCALILLLATAVTVLLLLRKWGSGERGSLKPADLWTPCWRNLHPRWLLFYRAFAFIAMAYLLYQTVAAFGFFVFFFYTQWTFALVMVYFAVAISFLGSVNSMGSSLVSCFGIGSYSLLRIVCIA